MLMKTVAIFWLLTISLIMLTSSFQSALGALIPSSQVLVTLDPNGTELLTEEDNPQGTDINGTTGKSISIVVSQSFDIDHMTCRVVDQSADETVVDSQDCTRTSDSNKGRVNLPDLIIDHQYRFTLTLS